MSTECCSVLRRGGRPAAWQGQLQDGRKRGAGRGEGGRTSEGEGEGEGEGSFPFGGSAEAKRGAENHFLSRHEQLLRHMHTEGPGATALSLKGDPLPPAAHSHSS